MKRIACHTFFFAVLLVRLSATAQELYQKPTGVQSRVSSFENPNGEKGKGGATNKGAKGNAFEFIYPGATKTLLTTKGQGIVQRIWLTVNQSPRLMRSLRLQMFWDGDAKPAVDVPMGDFFAFNTGQPVAFQSALFSSPEGRSFTCYVPMPFRKAARITVTNESRQDTCKLFYDVDFILTALPANAHYFHAFWMRQRTSAVGDDFTVLPTVQGSGRFLGMSVGVFTDSVYAGTWWGEGEVKMYTDGDADLPTIVGTGAEDYAGTGWGMGVYHHQYQGCTVADEKGGRYAFYPWHVPDAVYFDRNLKVTLQQIGGAPRNTVRDLMNKGVKLKPVSVDNVKGFVRMLESPGVSIHDKGFPEGWVNFYRTDDYSAVSYFYLNKTSGNLPSLPSVGVRTEGIK